MKIRYDAQGDTLDLLLKEGQIHRGEDFGQIIINYDEKNQPIEIEILNASKFLGEFLTGIIRAKSKAEMVELSM
jgi:uncharacterized protein YuzE